MLVAFATAGAAQTPNSTRSGIYTEAQATRGNDTYSNLCQSCHTPAAHTGKFLATWAGRPLSDLFEYLSTEMPKIDPGSLQPNEYAQVLAYMLKLNGLPAGQKELPADVAVLKSIRIDTALVKKGP
jgi:hypothetical protein